MDCFDVLYQEEKRYDSKTADRDKIKQDVANRALRLLSEEDYDEPGELVCEYAFFFIVKGLLVGAFKITTDIKSAYFVLCGDDIYRMNFTEKQYKEYVERQYEWLSRNQVFY